jgi:hypothetical protein
MCTCIQADVESSLQHAVPAKQWKCKYIISSSFGLYKKGNIDVEGYNKQTYCNSLKNTAEGCH